MSPVKKAFSLVMQELKIQRKMLEKLDHAVQRIDQNFSSAETEFDRRLDRIERQTAR